MAVFSRRARAERERFLVALADTAIRQDGLDVRLGDLQAEAGARQDTLRALTERVTGAEAGTGEATERIGRAEIGLHTATTHVAAHGAVLDVLDTRIGALEQAAAVARVEQVKLAALQAQVSALSERIERAESLTATTTAGLEHRIATLTSRLEGLRQVAEDRADATVQGLASLQARLDQFERAFEHTAAATDVLEARMTMIRVANDVARLDIELRGELARAVNHVATLHGLGATVKVSEPAPPEARVDVTDAAIDLSETAVDLRTLQPSDAPAG